MRPPLRTSMQLLLARNEPRSRSSSLVAQRHHGIDPDRAPGWEEAGEERDDEHEEGDLEVGDGIRRRDAEEEARKIAAEREAGGEPDGHAEHELECKRSFDRIVQRLSDGSAN